ncbi:DUF4124 domain-containing protein [Undibacterium sp. Ji49W]|uniref:DUF4124 domain-containing protein n=1 Tax=Undibacterium sp. Ji49W TaxID=3413040 RepID=UPI003BF235BB
MNKSLLFAIFCLSLSASCIAHAEVRKCVTSTGETIYTDQPCNAKVGTTATEVKGDGALRKISSLQKEKDTGKSCWVLAHRYQQCSTSVDSVLMTNFKENCESPTNKFIKDSNAEADTGYKKTYRDNRYSREQAPDADDLEYSHRYVNKSRAVLQCEVLQKDMWNYLKNNFSAKIPPADAKGIEYRLLGLPDPADNTASYSYRRKR